MFTRKTFPKEVGTSTIALLIIVGGAFFVTPYQIKGPSMRPILTANDVVLVEQGTLFLIPPRRGEVIALRNPHKQSEVAIKRIIGLPLETVAVEESGVTITRDDGTREYFSEGTLIGGSGMNGKTFTMYLGPFDYFLLGDNREESRDSRTFGAAQPTDFVGRIALKIPRWLNVSQRE